jgi:hypothetical protein
MHKMEETMKTLAVLFTLALGILLSGPAQAGEISSLLPGTGISLGLPGPKSLQPIFSLDLPQTLMASRAAATTQQQPSSDLPKAVSVEINVSKEGEGRAWYLSPVWMAIGGLGLVLVIILIVMAARGGGSGTTVVRG